MLLLGPTGAGKTPLGERIAAQGLWGHRWLHFDFGAQMRRAVTGRQANGFLSPEDLEFLGQVLDRGVLLEDHQFPIAKRIFESFLAASHAGPEHAVVLNGLPRHAGQAEAMEALVSVRAVVELVCTPEVVVQRIASNVGGDRTGRPDDQPEAVRRKLEIYAARTAPLIAHYRQRSVPILPVQVGAGMNDAQMFEILRSSPCP
jgi:adenylate kinase family enzyme